MYQVSLPQHGTREQTGWKSKRGIFETFHTLGVYYEANKGISKMLYSRSPLPTLTLLLSQFLF